LRQIENLEVVDRELNDEELDKVRKKGEIRAELAHLVKQTENEVVTDDEDNNISEDNIVIEEVEDMKRYHEEIEASDRFTSEKRVCTETLHTSNVPESIISRPITHFNETVVQTELLYAEEPQNSMVDVSKPIDQSNSNVIVEKPDEINPIPCSSRSSDDWEIVTKHKQTQINSKTFPEQYDVTEKSDCNKGLESKKDHSISTSKLSQKTNEPLVDKTVKRENVKENKEPSKSRKVKDLVREKLAKVPWSVHSLEGHEDLVTDCDLDLDLGLAVTASRDTTVKVWEVSPPHSLIYSLRGHRGAVTGARLLAPHQAALLPREDPDSVMSETWKPPSITRV